MPFKSNKKARPKLSRLGRAEQSAVPPNFGILSRTLPAGNRLPPPGNGGEPPEPTETSCSVRSSGATFGGRFTKLFTGQLLSLLSRTLTFPCQSLCLIFIILPRARAIVKFSRRFPSFGPLPPGGPPPRRAPDCAGSGQQRRSAPQACGQSPRAASFP